PEFNLWRLSHDRMFTKRCLLFDAYVYTFINTKSKVSKHPFCQLTQPKVLLSTQPYFVSSFRFFFTQIKIRFPSLDILQNHWKTLFHQYFNPSYSSALDINATTSTCAVWENMSTGCTSCVLNPPSSKILKSRANVDGLHDTYTIRFGCMSIIACSNASSHPLRGGSTTITSGRNPCCVHHGMTFSAWPTKNSAFVMPFSFAFIFASSIASGTISTPYTFFAFCARNNEIVPIPQYASMTISSGPTFAYSSAFSYNTFVCVGFTWQNDLGEILNFKLPIES